MAEPDTFVHATSKDNLMKILTAGRLKSLKHIADETPDAPISVESGEGDTNLASRERSTMAASKAYEKMKDIKAVDKVFLTRGGYEPSYGQHMIVKQLKSPKYHNWLNLVPNEYTTRRALSPKSRATVVVPEEEQGEFKKLFPGIKVRTVDQAGLKPFGMLDKVRSLAGKVVDRTIGFNKASAASIEGVDINNMSDTRVKQLFGRNAFVFGSQALGTADQASDVDVVVPYKRGASFEKAKQRMLEKYKGVLKPSVHNELKHKFTGMVNGVDLDVTLTQGEKAQKFRDAFMAAKANITPEEQKEIIATKQRLRNAWFFPEWRYNRYKRQLAKDLGLQQHYF